MLMERERGSGALEFGNLLNRVWMKRPTGIQKLELATSPSQAQMRHWENARETRKLSISSSPWKRQLGLNLVEIPDVEELVRERRAPRQEARGFLREMAHSREGAVQLERFHFEIPMSTERNNRG